MFEMLKKIFGEEKLYEDPNFVKTYDDDFDSTYGFYEFNVPDKWKDDFAKIRGSGGAESGTVWLGSH